MGQFGFDDEATLNRFQYKTPTPEQVTKMTEIRQAFHAVVRSVLQNAKPSADRTVALRAIHEANMLANASVMFEEV